MHEGACLVLELDPDLHTMLRIGFSNYSDRDVECDGPLFSRRSQHGTERLSIPDTTAWPKHRTRS